MRKALFPLLTLALASCAGDPPFRCRADADCAPSAGPQRVCEPDDPAALLGDGNLGRCSEASSSCESGHRFLSPGAPPGNPCVACGGLGQYCCGGNTCGAGTTCAQGRCTCFRALVTAASTSFSQGDRTLGQVCLLRETGDVACLDRDAQPASFVAVPSLAGMAEIAPAFPTICGRRPDGTVRCAGRAIDQPYEVPVVATSLGPKCATTSAGVTCWDDALKLTYTPLAGAVQVVGKGDISTSFSFWCARTIDGAVFCWGDNTQGQLGDGLQGTATSRLDPRRVAGLPPIVNLAARTTASVCAIDDAGGAWCWGYNFFGQLGDGTTTTSPRPVAVVGVSSARLLSTNAALGCALLADGAVSCWGLGTILTASPVAGVAGASLLNVDTNSACAVARNQVYCWGIPFNGDLVTVTDEAPFFRAAWVIQACP
jgi:hypothetical protein